MGEYRWVLELSVEELYELKDILQYDNLLIQPTGNQVKLSIASVIRQKVNALVEELEEEREIEIENRLVYGE